LPTEKVMNAHILIVDDDTRVTNALRRTLAYEGYHVTTALNGDRALTMVRTQPPDLVILDLMLPGIDGLEVCRRLRVENASIAVLMLTARDAVADRVAGLETGADDYLVKPFAFEELLARVKALLRRRNPPDIRREVLSFADLELDVVWRLRCWMNICICWYQHRESPIHLISQELRGLALVRHHGMSRRLAGFCKSIRLRQNSQI
jgi:DNA-binding response OmpR family regulator